jgi:hypothetical protein
MLKHIEEPCPLGCGGAEFSWWPVTHSNPTGTAYAFSCPNCGYFVLAEDQRTWLTACGDPFTKAALRGWLEAECGREAPQDYANWPWLTCDVLGLFDLAPKNRPPQCTLFPESKVCTRCYRSDSAKAPAPARKASDDPLHASLGQGVASLSAED